MADPDLVDENPTATGDDAAEPRPPLPRWKRLLLIGAGVFVALGLVLLPFEGGRSGDLSTSQGSASQAPGGAAGAGGHREAAGLQASGSSLVPGGTGTGAGGGTDPSAAAASGQDLSPVFLGLGFSFFVGFAIGYAFRAVLKLALIFVGLQFIVLYLLNHAGWVTIDTSAMATSWDTFVSRAGSDLESFKAFITGSLPKASLGTLGLYTGFKRR
ncbi:MAG: hypothetical protein IPM29_22240 [Planctomycetes bacterium]|nr:hypothetical protein [Planctomycetota bacterium]